MTKQEAIQLTIQGLENRIKHTASQGENIIYLDSDLSAEVKTHFINNGFYVSYFKYEKTLFGRKIILYPKIGW